MFSRPLPNCHTADDGDLKSSSISLEVWYASEDLLNESSECYWNIARFRAQYVIEIAMEIAIQIAIDYCLIFLSCYFIS